MNREQRAAMGKRFRQARERRGLLQKDAAALAHVPYRTYRSIETGETVGQEGHIVSIMEALDIQPLADDEDAFPITLKAHYGDIPPELDLYVRIAVQEWAAHFNDLLELDESARMAQIRQNMRAGLVPGDTTTAD